MKSEPKPSEVARLLNQIEMEYLAAQRGLTGLAEGAKHEAITARMENVGQLHESLRAIVGEEAIRLVAERLEACSEERKGSYANLSQALSRKKRRDNFSMGAGYDGQNPSTSSR